MRDCAQLGWLVALAILGSACTDETDPLLGPPTPLASTREASPEECSEGGTVVLSGLDNDRNGVLDASEITDSQVLCDLDPGPDGAPGEDGKNALVAVTVEPAGANCEFGGQRVDTGVDADADGALAPEEITQTTYVCDGAPGPRGFSFLVRTSTTVSEACERGGVLIEAGLDTDEDEVLDDGEVETSTELCAGVDGLDALVDVGPEAPGANCSAGGQRIRRGLDTNDNGVLDATEVVDTTFLCNPVATLIVTSSVGPGTDCALGGLRIDSGLDANGDSVLGPTEVVATRFLCEADDGRVALTRTATVGPGVGPCLRGGTRIDSGFDADGSGVLEAAEILSTTYACSASPGLDGRGANAVRISTEPSGANCAFGGTRVDTGPDTNGDGQLQDPEVTETRFFCSGADDAALVDVEVIPPGPICLNGGQRLREGRDDNGNGVLDANEVDSTTDVCTATPAVPMAILTAQLPSGFRSAAYEATITAAGGLAGNYEWSVTNGQLPPGLTLDPTGTPDTLLSGTPTAVGTFGFDVVVTDGRGAVAAQTFTLSLAAPPCEPGVAGVVGQSVRTITVPSTFGSGITGIAADTSTSGFVYVADSGGSLERFRKDGTTEENVLNLVTGIASGDVNTIHVIGQDIFLTNDNTSCSTNCVYRLSSDGGQTFSATSLGTFSPATNDALQGVALDGNTLYAITNDTLDAELWSIDLSGTLPAAATRVATLTTIDTCNGLELDGSYFYTVCDDIGDGREGLVRIDRVTLVPEAVAALTLSISSGSWAELDVVDTDGDGDLDVAYVQGDNNGSTTSPTGATYYVCNPGGTTPAFANAFLVGARDDEGLGYDSSTNSIWQLQESSSNLFRFD